MNWNFLLFYRWLLFNSFGGFLAFHAFASGFFESVIQYDASRISFVIIGVFLFHLLSSGIKCFNTSREINSVKSGNGTGKYHEFATNVGSSLKERYQAFSESLKLKIFSRLMLLNYLTAVPVALGLIGTVIGFILMLQGIPETGVTDAASAGALVGAMASGMGTALYTTLFGAILSLWSSVNYNMVAQGNVRLIAHILEYEAKDV